MAYIEEIREMGDGSVRDGVLSGIEQGYFHREIQDASFEYQERVEEGAETVVGVNEYTMDEDTRPEILEVDEGVQKRQQSRLAEVKAERDDRKVEDALATLEDAIETGENTMPAIVDAVKVGASMGEIMRVFEARHGSYSETVGVA
jgi:methylmalonyl-CoA mutase N-terminal domain/subunit